MIFGSILAIFLSLGMLSAGMSPSVWLITASATLASDSSNSLSDPHKSKAKSQDIVTKFDAGFYEKITSLIQANETREYSVVFFVDKGGKTGAEGKQLAEKNKELLASNLRDNYRAKDIVIGKVLSFVNANVTLTDALKLAEHDSVIRIGDGELPVVFHMDVARTVVNAANVTNEGGGVKIAVVDTGIKNDSPHPDLPIGPNKVVAQAECTQSGCNAGGNVDDWLNHGTRVAGIISGLGSIDSDYRGIAPATTIINARLPNNSEFASYLSAFTEAMDFAMQQDAAVINLSLGINKCSESYNISNLIADEAVDEGAVVVVSAGNDGDLGQDTIENPACGHNVISVGAINDQNNPNPNPYVLWPKSAKGPSVDLRMKPELIAPASLINTVDWCYGTFYPPYSDTNAKIEDFPGCLVPQPTHGTSFAAPFVTGATALLLSQDPGFSPLEAKALLLVGAKWNPNGEAGVPQTASQYENAGSSNSILNSWGFGLLDIGKSLEYAESGSHIAKATIGQGEAKQYAFMATENDQIKLILSWLKHPGGDIKNPVDVSISNLNLVIKNSMGDVVISSDSSLQNNEFAVFSAPYTGVYFATVSAPYVWPSGVHETFALASSHPLETQPGFGVKQGSFVKAVPGSNQFVRPTNDLSTGGWTEIPLWDKLDESPASDSDYVTSPSGTAPEFQVGLPNIVDPETGSGHIIKFRAKASAGSGSSERANAILFQGDTQIAQTGLKSLSRTQFTTFAYTLGAAEADNITNYNNLSIRITTSMADAEVIQVSWIEFEVPASIAVNSITDVGFAPKAVILYTTGQSVQDGFDDGYQVSIGLTDGINSRTVAVASDDAASNSNSGRAFGTKVLKILDSGAPTISAEADLTGFTSSGFNIKWTTNDSTPAVIHYFALGGGDVQNVAVSSFASSTTEGNQAVTGVGFRPDFVMLMHAASASETGASSHGYLSYGFASSPTRSGSLAVASEDGRSTMDTWRSLRIDRAVIALNESTGALDGEAQLASLDADGFTLNWVDALQNADKIYYLALKGGNYDVGNFTKIPTGLSDQSIATVGFRPDGLLLTSVNDSNWGAVQFNNRVSFGASDGISEGAIWSGDSDNVPDALTARKTSVDKVITMATEQGSGSASTLNAAADLKSFDPTGFTLGWTTNDDEDATRLIYVAFGSVDLTSGLVGHWNLDEATGLTAADDSGNNNHGTLTNGPTWLSGASCVEINCLSFDGANDYVSVLDSTTLDGMSGLTVSIWVKRNEIRDSSEWILGKSTTPFAYNSGSYEIYMAPGGNIRNRIFIQNALAVDFGGGYIADTTSFHHVVLTYNHGTPKTYLDGVFIYSPASYTPNPINNTPYPLTFAYPVSNSSNGGNPPQYFSGVLDEIRIYNRALTDVEILMLYQGYSSSEFGPMSPAGLSSGGEPMPAVVLYPE